MTPKKKWPVKPSGQTKQCNRCKEVKPFEEFHTLRASPDGKQPRCKECQRVLAQAYWEAKGRRDAAAKAKQVKIVVKRKICHKCNRLRLAKMFYKRSVTRDGLSYYCKQCEDVSNKKWKDENPEKSRAHARESAKNWRLKRDYGITYEQYLEMFAAQGDVCAICLQPETKPSNNGLPTLSVDHCHDSKRVRALLCHKCNQRVGMMEAFMRNPEYTAKLVAYIKKHRAADSNLDGV